MKSHLKSSRHVSEKDNRIGQCLAAVAATVGTQNLPSASHRPFADPVDGNALLLRKMSKLSQLLLPSHSNHHNDNQEALEDYRYCYKSVINPYKSSKLHYPHFKPLLGVRASQHSSCVATCTEFEACKTQAGNPQMQTLCLIHNLRIQKMMVNVSLLSDSPITSSPQYHYLQVCITLWV